MNRAAYLYVFCVLALAASLLILPPWFIGSLPTSRDLFGLVALVGLAVLAEALAIDVAVGSTRSASSSIAFIPLFACLILFPPYAAIAATAIVQATTQLLTRRRTFLTAAFNIAQGIVAAAVAALVFQVLGGRPATQVQVPFVAFAALALAFFGTNLLLVAGYIALRRGNGYLEVIGQAVGPGGGNLVYDLLASPIALVVSILYAEFYIGGLVLILLPLMLVRYSYLSKVQLQQANRDLLRALIKAIETRDPYTSGHSLRVSTLARAIAVELGLGGRRTEQVETAALLHDIGKIDGIYTAIISKPHDLSADERKVIRTHATKGAELLRTLSSFGEEVVKGVRHHHERYDGTGYPDGLKGDDIPIAGRIIMLCDAVDAMLSDRPYRKALSVETVRGELLKGTGTQFDPQIVRRMLAGNALERAAALVGREPEQHLILQAAQSA